MLCVGGTRIFESEQEVIKLLEAVLRVVCRYQQLVMNMITTL